MPRINQQYPAFFSLIFLSRRFIFGFFKTGILEPDKKKEWKISIPLK